MLNTQKEHLDIFFEKIIGLLMIYMVISERMWKRIV